MQIHFRLSSPHSVFAVRESVDPVSLTTLELLMRLTNNDKWTHVASLLTRVAVEGKPLPRVNESTMLLLFYG
jgi:hypothetical protein